MPTSEDENQYFKHTASESEFLRWYRAQHPSIDRSPLLTVDDVLISYRKKEDELKLLLIQRDTHPFKGSWALPGGFVLPKEAMETCCIRNTFEETGVQLTRTDIEQLYCFSEPDRDPRGWVVTVSYLAFIGKEEPLIKGKEARNACWFTLKRVNNHLILTYQDIRIELDLVTKRSIGEDRLAFDHDQIILTAYERILHQMYNNPRILLVLGSQFTISEARKVFAQILGIDFRLIDHSNFKKSMLKYFKEIGESPTGIGRPSKIYQLEKPSGSIL